MAALWVFLKFCAKDEASRFAPTCSIKSDFEKSRAKCGWERNDRASESDVYDPKIPCIEACNPGEAARDDRCGGELAGLYGRPRQCRGLAEVPQGRMAVRAHPRTHRT